MNINKIGVLGAGVMGSGLSHVLAQTDHEVFLVDTSQEALDKVKDGFINSIRMQMLFNKDLNVKNPEDILKKVVFSSDYNMLSGVDYLIESVTELSEIKKEVLTKSDDICRPNCVFASNTSAISIKKLASFTRRPDRVIGLHFMNPVAMTSTVEMIRSELTSPETIEISKQLLVQMNKQWVLVNDSCGFVSNRVLMLTINETICLVEENVASVEDIDKVFKTCFGYKMGPLETADLIGLDTIQLSLEVLYGHYQDTKFKPCSLLARMVKEGNWGRKTGQGFYNYKK
jgi:3-hydroxybutyryl-CoA dehydrogenase